ncbi:unnamed protein product [Ilex paraguariensis]|uniref:Uncharacterized protein n=1 Tax=Ilex paraguariensis TaxID=185542 RepID=A0ABC8UZ43_9AQUA
MEKLLKPYDKEYMKMAMLKHEETFKEQVNELHRLYQIQKMLMRNIESSKSNGRNRIDILNHHHGMHQKPRRRNLNLEHPATEYAESDEVDVMLEIEDESEIELTLRLGPTSYDRRRRRRGGRKDETPPITSDSGHSFSSSSSGSNYKFNRTPQRTDTTREDQQRLRQERLNQSPWIFQVLSLSMT